MIELFNPKTCYRSGVEWLELLEQLLAELSEHLEIELDKCSFFIEEQFEGEASYGCNIDFTGTLSRPLEIKLCGVLCFTAGWERQVNIGAFLLYYQSEMRLAPNADDEKVVYIPRGKDGWGEPQVQSGEGGEWSQYNTPERWNNSERENLGTE